MFIHWNLVNFKAVLKDKWQDDCSEFLTPCFFFPRQATRYIKSICAAVHLKKTARLKSAVLRRRTMPWRTAPTSVTSSATVKRRKRTWARTPSCESTHLQITDSGLSVRTQRAWLNCEHTLHSAGRAVTQDTEFCYVEFFCLRSETLGLPFLNLFI